MRLLKLGSVVLASALAACNPAAVSDDPTRAAFIAGCDGLRETRSMKPERRAAYCSCGYDQTMAGLTDEEKQFAQFYLLQQAGGYKGPTNFIEKGNMQAMMKASNAIGAARRRCG